MGLVKPFCLTFHLESFCHGRPYLRQSAPIYTASKLVRELILDYNKVAILGPTFCFTMYNLNGGSVIK